MRVFVVFFFKQKTAYEMRISDWSSDVCSSDLDVPPRPVRPPGRMRNCRPAHDTVPRGWHDPDRPRGLPAARPRGAGGPVPHLRAAPPRAPDRLVDHAGRRPSLLPARQPFPRSPPWVDVQPVPALLDERGHITKGARGGNGG